jgi:ubiquinone biosynthesis protein UbiJ
MLIEASERFVAVLSQKPALVPLYKNKRMDVEINGGEERVWIRFDDGHCERLVAAPERVDVTVNGSIEDVMALVNGSERLMLLEEEGRLKVEGHLRHLLALESLFLLTESGAAAK